MDIEEIKKIIELMKKNEISEFELEEEELRIAVKRNNGNEPQVIMSAASSPQLVVPQASAGSTAAPAPGTQTLEGTTRSDMDASAGGDAPPPREEAGPPSSAGAAEVDEDDLPF